MNLVAIRTHRLFLPIVAAVSGCVAPLAPPTEAKSATSTACHAASALTIESITITGDGTDETGAPLDPDSDPQYYVKIFADDTDFEVATGAEVMGPKELGKFGYEQAQTSSGNLETVIPVSATTLPARAGSLLTLRVMDYDGDVVGAGGEQLQDTPVGVFDLALDVPQNGPVDLTFGDSKSRLSVRVTGTARCTDQALLDADNACRNGQQSCVEVNPGKISALIDARQGICEQMPARYEGPYGIGGTWAPNGPAEPVSCAEVTCSNRYEQGRIRALAQLCSAEQ